MSSPSRDQSTPGRAGRALPWFAPSVLWASLPVVAGPALAAALDGASAPVQLVAALGMWAGWLVALVALLVRSTVSLTVARTLVPLAPVACLAAAFAGASPSEAALAVGVSLAAAVLAFSADVGEAFVQGSAYGDERRFPLRPPAPLLLVLPLAWAAACAAAVAGPLLLAARAWVAGALITLIAVPLVVGAGRRFHRVTTRWLVLVPAGLVLHDPLVLADTAMFRTAEVAGLAMAAAGTQALDLTGGRPGPALEVRLVEAGTVVLAGTLRSRQGQGLHVRSFVCAPSRPGRALQAAAARRLPVER